MRDFLTYLRRLASRGVAAALIAFDLLAFAIGLARQDLALPGWTYLALLVIGFVAGAYQLERESRVRIAELQASISTEQEPQLTIEFVDIDAAKRLGGSIDVRSEVLQVPEQKEIPQLGGASVLFVDPFLNRMYFRELAVYLEHTSLLKPMRFGVMNASGTLATHVEAELTIPMIEGLTLGEEDDFSLVPPRRKVVPILSPALLSGVSRGRSPATASVQEGKREWTIRLEIERVKPKAFVSIPDILYVGANRSMAVPINGLIFADNLRNPTTVSLTVMIKATHKSLGLDDLLALQSDAQESEDE